MSETIKYCEHKITMLEKVNKILNDTNKSLHESTERLVKLNEKQQEMLGTLNESLGKDFSYIKDLYKIIQCRI